MFILKDSNNDIIKWFSIVTKTFLKRQYRSIANG